MRILRLNFVHIPFLSGQNKYVINGQDSFFWEKGIFLLWTTEENIFVNTFVWSYVSNKWQSKCSLLLVKAIEDKIARTLSSSKTSHWISANYSACCGSQPIKGMHWMDNICRNTFLKASVSEEEGREGGFTQEHGGRGGELDIPAWWQPSQSHTGTGMFRGERPGPEMCRWIRKKRQKEKKRKREKR